MEEAPGIPAFHIQDLMIRDPCHDTAALDLIGVDIGKADSTRSITIQSFS